MSHATSSTAPSIRIDPAVLARAHRLAATGQRRILGIVGAPASGKSTLADRLAIELGQAVAGVPMDGFHLSQQQLTRLNRAQRKGAPDTFDVAGYRDLLQRIRRAFTSQETVYAPGFYRDIEEPIAASLAIHADTPLVITEGNYLLLEDEPWPDVTDLLDEIWFLDIDTDAREQRLLARHERFGRSPEAAVAWMQQTDRPNAERINATAERADCRLRWDGDCIRFCNR